MRPPNEIDQLGKEQHMNTQRPKEEQMGGIHATAATQTGALGKKAASPAVIILGQAWVRSILRGSLTGKKVHIRQGWQGWGVGRKKLNWREVSGKRTSDFRSAQAGFKESLLVRFN